MFLYIRIIQNNYLYRVFIILSIIFYLIYTFALLRKNKINYVTISYIIIIPLIIICGKLLTVISNKNVDFFTASLSSYGGVIGMIIGTYTVFVFTKKKDFVIYNILSLPMMYSISKISCLINGCCIGIPYKGLFAIYYPNVYFDTVFPIQLVESIIFLIIFIIMNYLHFKRNNKYVIELTIIISAIAKFLLDFLRFSHINEIVSLNQIISLFLIIICSIVLFERWYKNEKKI